MIYNQISSDSACALCAAEPGDLQETSLWHCTLCPGLHRHWSPWSWKWPQSRDTPVIHRVRPLLLAFSQVGWWRLWTARMWRCTLREHHGIPGWWGPWPCGALSLNLKESGTVTNFDSSTQADKSYGAVGESTFSSEVVRRHEEFSPIWSFANREEFVNRLSIDRIFSGFYSCETVLKLTIEWLWL